MPTSSTSEGLSKHLHSGKKQEITFSDFLPAAILLLFGLSALMIAAIFAFPDNGRYIVVARPGSTVSDTLTIVKNAQGGLQQLTRHSNIVIASSSTSDFTHKLRDSGAWFVIPSPVKTGCFSDAPGDSL